MKLDGRPGRSESISESKRRDAFLSEYYLAKSIANINEVEETWLERSWRFTRYSYDQTQFRDEDGQQFCANLKSQDAAELFKSWSIKRDSAVLTYGIYGDNTLVISLRNPTDADTLRFFLYRGDDKNVHSQSDFLGTLVFVKKR